MIENWGAVVNYAMGLALGAVLVEAGYASAYTVLVLALGLFAAGILGEAIKGGPKADV